MIIPGSASQSVAVALARELDEPLIPVTYDRFPDGERLVTLDSAAIESAQTDRAVVVASTVDSSAHVELLLLHDAVREAGIDHTVTVIPYLGYARQDRAFEPGEPVSARAVARAIGVETDRVLTVTPHERQVCDYFDVPTTPVAGTRRLAEALPTSLEAPIFIAPDEGARDLARTVREAYGHGSTDVFEKRRLSGTAVEIAPSERDVTDRSVVIVDDIIATGGTMSEAIAALGDRAPESITVACVHPLLVGNARTRLATAGADRIVATDTIERSVSSVSVAPLVAEALRAD